MPDTRSVEIPVGDVTLDGDLAQPEGARGLVLFAHGSGSSRHSPRNRLVAEVLRDRGLGTLLVDLLTVAEEREDERTRALRFDIGLLAGRLDRIAAWLAAEPATAGLDLGVFGASTGAGAALIAASWRPEAIGAVVSRGGRPDLAEEALRVVKAPTLLMVGSLDTVVIELNHRAYRQLTCPKALEIVRGASHLFEEPGTLEQVARLAGDWFGEHLARSV